MSTTFNENNSIAALHQLLRDKGFEEGVLDEFDRSFVLTDPSLEDNPLVWVSQEFLTVTGYQREEVIGRNCRFLQGPDTQAKDVRQIRQFIDSQEPGSVRILNYTKSGTPFINEFAVVPLQLDGKTLLFLGAQSMLTFGPPSDSPHSLSFSPRQSESTSSPSSPSFLSPSSSVSSSSSDSMSSEPPSFDSSTSDTSISEASTSDSSSADSSSSDSSSSDSSSSDSSSSDSSLSSAGIEQINPETVEVEAGPSSVLVTSSGRTTRPNGRFIPFESEFCQGRVLLKTRGTPAANPNVAGYFSGRNRLFELQVQFTMKQDVPLDHDIIIGGEVRRPMDLGWGSKFVASSILGILKLFNVSLHHSFGDRQQYAHLCFPFSVLPDSLIVTPSDQRPPSLTYGDLVGPSVLGRVGPDFRPTTGNVYTLSFYSQYIDFENWSVVRLPGVSSVSLKTFWSECPLNIVAYAVPRSAPIHAITQRLDLFELEIAHLSLLNLDRQINF